jgi:hypothetical protein
MMEAANTSESSVNIYQTAGRKNQEDSHLHTRRRENLRSHSQVRVQTRVHTEKARFIFVIYLNDRLHSTTFKVSCKDVK